MNIADLSQVQSIAEQRAELSRVFNAIDNATTFRVVMSVSGAADVSCPLPPSYVEDMRKVLQKQVNALDKQLRDLGVTV